MGLDNGIVIKMKEGKEAPKFADARYSYKNKIEVCYWRKCWGIRGAILSVLDPKGIREKEIGCGKYPIETEDIPALIKALKPFFSKEYWDEEGESIWEFDDIFETQIEHVINLEKLKEFIENNQDDIEEVYFYDSY